MEAKTTTAATDQVDECKEAGDAQVPTNQFGSNSRRNTTQDAQINARHNKDNPTTSKTTDQHQGRYNQYRSDKTTEEGVEAESSHGEDDDDLQAQNERIVANIVDDSAYTGAESGIVSRTENATHSGDDDYGMFQNKSIKAGDKIPAYTSLSQCEEPIS